MEYDFCLKINFEAIYTRPLNRFLTLKNFNYNFNATSAEINI